MAAFARALAVGADGIETDVRLTADGKVVVFHDEHAARIAGVRRSVSLCALREVQSWDVGHGFEGAGGRRPFAGAGHRAPTLADVLEQFPHTCFNVDLKPRGRSIVEAAIRTVRALGAEDRVLLTSFHGDTVRAVRAQGYGGPTGSATVDVLRLLARPLAALAPGAHPAHAVQVPFRAGPWSLPFAHVLARCRAVGARLDVFTINEPSLAQRVAAEGADGIMTDDPARIAVALGRAPAGP